MKQVRTSLNNNEYHKFLQQCEALEESEYRFVKTAIEERMKRNKSLLKKIEKWLVTDHKLTGS